MNTQSNVAPEAPMHPAVVAAALPASRLFYWSIRREMWENRSIVIAPLAAGALGVIAFILSRSGMAHKPDSSSMDYAHQRIALAMPYAHIEMLLVLTSFLVGIYYSLDALHGERRDKSILFWKSLPVSDLITVLSKASIPLLVLPLLVVIIAFALQWTMLIVSGAVLLLTGSGAAALWSRLPIFQIELGLLYSVCVMVVWHAPMYAWLLLVSGWARRATFLWAVLPPIGITAFEYITFHTTHVGRFLTDRLFGFPQQAFNLMLPDGSMVDSHFIPLTQFTPGRLLSSPGLWLGLIAAAGLLAATVRLRRYREPI